MICPVFCLTAHKSLGAADHARAKKKASIIKLFPLGRFFPENARVQKRFFFPLFSYSYPVGIAILLARSQGN